MNKGYCLYCEDKAIGISGEYYCRLVEGMPNVKDVKICPKEKDEDDK